MFVDSYLLTHNSFRFISFILSLYFFSSIFFRQGNEAHERTKKKSRIFFLMWLKLSLKDYTKKKKSLFTELLLVGILVYVYVILSYY